MKSNKNVLLLATLLSLVSLSLVLVWYKLTEPEKKSDLSLKPIAIIKKTIEEVDRRPYRRQIWQSVSAGEPVYSGEAIRTSKNSQAKIEFLDGAKSITLEPESTILIYQQKNKEFTLDLMEGGAAVSVDSSDSGTLKLLQNGKNIDIIGSALLTKSSTGELEVEDDKDDGTFLKVNNDPRIESFKVEYPQRDQIIYIDEVKNEIEFKWPSLPEDLMIKFSWGQSRSNLDNKIESHNSQIKIPAEPGFYYYKIDFINKNNKLTVATSKIQRIKVVNRIKSYIVSPQYNSKFKIFNESINPKLKVNFDVSIPEMVTKSKLVLYLQDKKVYESEIAKNKKITLELGLGKYKAKLISFYDQENNPIESALSQFDIIKDLKIDPDKIGYKLIEWNNISSATKNELAIYQKYIEIPKLNLFWDSKKTKDVSMYRVKIFDFDQNNKLIVDQIVNNPNYQTALSKPGRYLASVQGLDSEENVIANSEKKVFTITEQTLLKAPVINETNLIFAQADGTVSVTWRPVDEAVQYYYELVNFKNEIILSGKIDLQFIVKLKKLFPGDYQFNLAAVDQFKRPGQFSSRIIKVPDKSNIKSPQIKRFKVNQNE